MITAMTSYEFEIAAKNAVATVCHEQFGENYDIGTIQVVWFAHLLGNKKAILIDQGKNRRFYEVTYSRDKHEMYVDTYEKLSNVVVLEPDIQTHPPSDSWD